MPSKSQQRQAELSALYPLKILLWGHVGKQLGSFCAVQGLSPKHHLAECPGGRETWCLELHPGPAKENQHWKEQDSLNSQLRENPALP